MKTLLLLLLPVYLAAQNAAVVKPVPTRRPAAPAFEFTATSNASQTSVPLVMGYSFSVKAPVVLTSLGAVLQGTAQPVFGTLPQSMVVAVWDDAQNLLVSETVSASDELTGHFNYHPVRETLLMPGVNYTIAGLVTAGMSVLSDVPDLTPGAAVVYGGPRSLISKTLAIPEGDDAGRKSYFGAGFMYIGGESPVALAGRDRYVRPGALVKLNGTESFTERGGQVMWNWKLIAAPEGTTAMLKDADSAAPAFVPDREGLYVAELTVYDGRTYSVPSKVSITVLSITDAAP
jgi:hypothetical protein